MALLPACGSVQEVREGEEPGVSEAAIAVAPPLGTAQSFAVLGATTVTNTGPTVITGDLGVSPGTAITGFPPGNVIGTIHAMDAAAAQARNDAAVAYANLAGQACDFTFPTSELGGLTLGPGVYCFATGAATLNGTLTLNALGNPNAVWVFKTASTLITGSNSNVLLINGAQPRNVFWQVGSSATLGTNSTFAGNILALTSITVTTSVAVNGRALALNGAVTLDSNTITVDVGGGPVPPGSPTLSKAFTPSIISAGGASNLTITLSNPNPAIALLTAPLVDTLAAGLTVAGTGSTTCGGLVTASANTVTLLGGFIPANGSCTVTVPVTSPVAGRFVNILPAGALRTTRGNNAAPAVALLIVTPGAGVAAPTVTKCFSPSTIKEGGTSTLVITLTNPNSTPAALTAPLIDTLPAGLTTLPGPAANTCGGVVTTTPYEVTLKRGSIPANGFCTVTVNVTAKNEGSYCNEIPRGALQTDKGSNLEPATATLTVKHRTKPPPKVTE
ncbi:DUF3494 domain-containing protein [Corallococcus terminator]|uniref:DUF3494 domain-containing protein n=2 Tax=Corallococcus terminator TaxID=2316733 RepID=A0A3A8JDA4_9BACT|nr:DUF3494 domain-containing protein [Corallococcus terminator]